MLLYLYMASMGGGIVSGKLIMASARRVRVTCAIRPQIASDIGCRPNLNTSEVLH